MKHRALLLCTAGCLALTTAGLHSQWPAATPSKSPLAALKAMKAANADLIEQQKKTISTLDDIGAAAETIRIRGKRT